MRNDYYVQVAGATCYNPRGLPAALALSWAGDEVERLYVITHNNEGLVGEAAALYLRAQAREEGARLTALLGPPGKAPAPSGVGAFSFLGRRRTTVDNRRDPTDKRIATDGVRRAAHTVLRAPCQGRRVQLSSQVSKSPKLRARGRARRAIFGCDVCDVAP